MDLICSEALDYLRFKVNHYIYSAITSLPLSSHCSIPLLYPLSHSPPQIYFTDSLFISVSPCVPQTLLIFFFSHHSLPCPSDFSLNLCYPILFPFPNPSFSPVTDQSFPLDHTLHLLLPFLLCLPSKSTLSCFSVAYHLFPPPYSLFSHHTSRLSYHPLSLSSFLISSLTTIVFLPIPRYFSFTVPFLVPLPSSPSHSSNPSLSDIATPSGRRSQGPTRKLNLHNAGPGRMSLDLRLEGGYGRKEDTGERRRQSRQTGG